MTRSQSGYWLVRQQAVPLDKVLIMGILNVTPDSFSDGGDYFQKEQALKQALALKAAGADIIDVGGESTRPGADAISSEEEIDRVLPVIEAILSFDTLVSVDTRKADVAKAALAAGVHIVNDVSAGTTDPKMLATVARAGAGYVLMHMQGTPESMQINPGYAALLPEIDSFFSQRLQAAETAGIQRNSIVLDPGIGFGKTLADNLTLIGHISHFGKHGLPLLLGASRKSFIGAIDGSIVSERLGGSLAAVLAAYQQGTTIFRVHDVAETRQLLQVFTAIDSHSD